MFSEFGSAAEIEISWRDFAAQPPHPSLPHHERARRIVPRPPAFPCHPRVHSVHSTARHVAQVKHARAKLAARADPSQVEPLRPFFMMISGTVGTCELLPRSKKDFVVEDAGSSVTAAKSVPATNSAPAACGPRRMVD